ncbi:MAG TPA: LamG-like jellyroll fold domain-containing protein, partial [Verrucomicrobiae bacterium]|nr:LamG-like jellyroll fold domain-containing protein [Verrucomicrobiae bacterium]
MNGSITVVDSSASPVFVAQPTNQVVGLGGSATFSAVAAGSRPLSYQWQKGSQVIPGATGTSLVIASAGTNDIAQYSVIVSNAFGNTTSLAASLTLLPPGATSITNGLLVYLNFDGNLTAQGGTTNNGLIYTGGAARGPRYTTGVAGSAATFTNTASAGQPDDWAVTLGNLDWLYAGSFSVSLWERTSTSADGALIGNKNWSSGANVGWVISSLDPKNVNWNAVGGTRRDIQLNPPFSDGGWHLITVTFDRNANQVTSYMDGAPANVNDISPSATASFSAGLNTLVGSSGNGAYSGAADIDDLGLWNRVLSPAEIAGIYGAGLRHQPLVTAHSAVPPVIQSQPAGLNVTSGSAATFSVTALGPGPLNYQWRFDGTDIPGATGSTLYLPSVSAANQGVYTVIVDNGAGAVVSSSALLWIYSLAVTGQWDFDRGDLRATVGADLEYLADTLRLTSFPFSAINGQRARVMAFGSNAASEGYYMRHGAQPNGGGHFVNQYTLVMDIMFPASSSGQLRALFQTDPFNHDGNDAEFYIGDASSSPGHDGLGAEGQFNGSLLPDRWHRIVFAVDLAAPAGQQLSTYIDGTKVGSQSLSGGIDGRFAVGPTALLFTSGNSGGGDTQPGLVNSIQFLNGCLAADAVAALGGPSAAGLPPGNGVLQISGISRNASVLELTWTGPDGSFQVQTATSLADPHWVDFGRSTTNRTLAIPVTGNSAFYRVKQSQPDIQVGQLPLGTQSLPSKQLLRAAGQELQFSGRPVDLTLSPDGATLFIKNITSLLVVDVGSWRVVQTLNYPGSGASMHGIAVNKAGTHVYLTGAGNELYDWAVNTNGSYSLYRTIHLPAGSDPCGVTLSADGTTAYVCLSISNALAVVDLAAGTVTRQIG